VFVKEVPKKLKEATKTAGMVAAGAVLGVAALATKYADLGQKSRAAFGMMLGSKELGANAFSESRRLAVEYGMSIEEVTGSYQRFLSMGFDRGESAQIIKMGADMSALGASSEKVSSVLDAMGKIKATGSLQGDELMMLAEAGINIGKIYDTLGAKFGKTRAQIVKMKEAGKISAEDAIDALKQTVLATTGQKEFGLARKNIMASTLSGSFQQMKARVVDAMIGIGDAAGPQLTKMVTSILDLVGGFVKSDSGKSFLGDMAELAGQVADGIRSSLPYVKEFIGAFSSGFGETISILGDAFKGLFGDTKSEKTLETIRGIAVAAGRVAAALVGVAATMGILYIGAVRVGAAIQQYIVAAWEFVSLRIYAVIDAVNNLIAKLSALTGVNIVQQLSTIQIPDVSKVVPGAPAQIAGSKPGAVTNTTTNTVPVTVNVTAPEGGTAADGQAWGQGAGRGIERGIMGALGGAVAAGGV
jgi:tape measure domain-containing protein